MTTYDSLLQAFNPKSIALVGASNRPGNVGRALLQNMVGSTYEGAVYPVNPKRKSVMGMKVYPDLTSIPDPVELAIIATPPDTIPSIVEQCGACRIGAAVIISAGFQEAGRAGQRLLNRVVKKAKEANVRLLGPNSLGFLRPSIGLNASFANVMARPGRLAFISQSGALCTAILDWSIRENIGFSHFISIGSMVDIGYHDLIDYLGQDPETSSILIYMESIKDARGFMSAARSIGKNKPIVVLKAGRTPEGAAAIHARTGERPGEDALYDALFKRSGIARVNTIKELFNVAQTLSTQPPPKGNRLLVLTNAGGPGAVATDAHVRLGGRMATLSRETLEALDKKLPQTWSHGNPVDLLGDADVTRFSEAFKICLSEPNADGILIVLTPQAATNAAEIGEAIGRLAQNSGKTILASFMGADQVSGGIQALASKGIPNYDSPEEGADCFNTMARYGRNQTLLAETPVSVPSRFKPKTAQARALIEKALSSGRASLNEIEASKFISYYGIQSAPHAKATSSAQASRLAAGIGFPVALKILSPDILHKLDVGGVQLHVSSQRGAAEAYRQIVASVAEREPSARIDGVLVEKMVPGRHELVLGSKRDELFGPVIRFGLGGVGVEIYKDINVGLPPLNMALAKRLIEGTRIHQLLAGYRGLHAVDLKSLQALLYRFSYLVMDFPEIKDIEINPLAIDANGCLALDSKVTLDEQAKPRKSNPYSHLIISPYPKKWEKRISSKLGKSVLLRPIRPEDEPMEEAMFKAMSAETQRFRFFAPIKYITHEMLVRYTQIDYDREIAVVAELNDKGRKIAGVARVIADAYNDSAEFAVVVADPWQDHGLGNALTDHVLQLARQRKLGLIYAHFLPDNRAIRHILEKRGFVTTPYDDSLRCELDLRA